MLLRFLWDSVYAVREMTALIVALDGLSWDITMIADGLSVKKTGEIWETDAVKTVRINDDCAFGSTGIISLADHIIAQVMGKPEWAGGHSRFSVMRRLEEQQIGKPDLSYGEAKGEIERLLEQALSEMDASTLRKSLGNLVLVGNDGQLNFCCWASERQWQAQETIVNHQDSRAFIMVPKPHTDPLYREITAILAEPETTISDKALRSVALAAKKCPQCVNEYTTLRRLSNRFQLERLSSP